MITKINNTRPNFTSRNTSIITTSKKGEQELNLLIQNSVLPIVKKLLPDVEYKTMTSPGMLTTATGTTHFTKIPKKGQQITVHSFCTPSGDLLDISSTNIKKVLGKYIVKDGLEGNNIITGKTGLFIKRLAYLIIDHLK